MEILITRDGLDIKVIECQNGSWHGLLKQIQREISLNAKNILDQSENILYVQVNLLSLRSGYRIRFGALTQKDGFPGCYIGEGVKDGNIKKAAFAAAQKLIERLSLKGVAIISREEVNV